MADSPRNPWDAFKGWGQFTPGQFSSGQFTPGQGGSAAAWGQPFGGQPDLEQQITKYLKGRHFDTTLGNVQVSLTVADVDVPLGGRGLGMGQLDDVRLEVADLDLDWGQSLTFSTAAATMRNVHLRFGSPATIIGAPVELTASLPVRTLVGLLAAYQPKIVLEFAPTGPRVRWAQHPGWGYCEIDLDVEGTSILVAPRAVVVRGRRLQKVGKLPPWSVRLPLPADKLSLTSATIRGDQVELTGRLGELRIPLDLKGLARRLGS